MQVRVITPHITSKGAVAPGTVLDLSDEIAIDYLNSNLAVAHKVDETETATAKKAKETATAK